MKAPPRSSILIPARRAQGCRTTTWSEKKTAAVKNDGIELPVACDVQVLDRERNRMKIENLRQGARSTTNSWRGIAAAGLLFCAAMVADPLPVRHVQGYVHGFLLLKNTDDKVLASGDLVQIPNGNRVTDTLSLQFSDGSFYEETSVYSQSRVYRLLSYKQVMKGPAFKTPGTLSLDASSGTVNISYTDKDGKEKTTTEKLSLPPDLANGILSLLLMEADPKVETTLSMLVSTPKPLVVKLKVVSPGQDSYSLGGASGKATHYIVKIDIGGLTGVAAKVLGKQPPPVDMWVAAGNAPVFLKSEGPLYRDGPVWRIELASPVWPKAPQKSGGAGQARQTSSIR
jgi:hypothetical protein